jgi:hypothetical protein
VSLYEPNIIEPNWPNCPVAGVLRSPLPVVGQINSNAPFDRHGGWPVAALHHHPLVSQLDFLLLIMRDLDYDDATSIDVNNSIDADDGDNNNNNNDNNDTANANPKMN